MTKDRLKEIKEFADKPHTFENGSISFTKEQIMLQELLKDRRGSNYFER